MHRLGVAGHALDYWVAAMRRCFEEAGLFYAREADGRPLVLDAERAARLDAWRGPLQRGERSLAALCHEEGLTLAADELVYFSHWVTPPVRAKRFDTPSSSRARRRAAVGARRRRTRRAAGSARPPR